MTTHGTPDALTVARLAAEAGVDRRTILKRLRGETVRGLAGARADQALARLRSIDASPQPADGPTPQPEAKGDR